MDLEIIHGIYLTGKKTFPEKSRKKHHFLATCSLFFFSSENDIHYVVVIKLRPYGGLIDLHWTNT